jgi:L-gulonate 5-dehydrogenase
MKAIVFHAPYNVSVEDVEKPSIRDGEALIEVIQVGICGGDIHFYDGSQPYANYPQIYGHEVVGRVVELPVNYTGEFHVGDIIVPEILLPCGKCYPCRHGKFNCCVNLKVIGAHTPGAFAEYAVYPIANLHKIPDSLSFDSSVVIEPYSIGYHCIERSNIPAGETALVIGAGAIGLTIIDILKTRKVKVISADLSDFRLGMAQKMGADFIINSASENLLERLLELTNGEGAGFVFEATGVPYVMSLTENLVAAGGTIVIVGLTTDKVEFTGLNFTKREMNVLGSRNSTNAFEPIINLMVDKKLHPKVLLTKKFPIDNAVECFNYTYVNFAKEGKVVITVNE